MLHVLIQLLLLLISTATNTAANTTATVVLLLKCRAWLGGGGGTGVTPGLCLPIYLWFISIIFVLRCQEYAFDYLQYMFKMSMGLWGRPRPLSEPWALTTCLGASPPPPPPLPTKENKSWAQPFNVLLHYCCLYRLSPKKYNPTFSINNFQNCSSNWICFRIMKLYLHVIICISAKTPSDLVQ